MDVRIKGCFGNKQVIDFLFAGGREGGVLLAYPAERFGFSRHNLTGVRQGIN